MIKISVITVCYNAEKSIEDTILSVLHQDYNNIEYIIIDGGSKDNTISIVEKYRKKYKNIKYISEQDHGIYDAMNKGISIATGEYIFFLNSGDKFYNNKVISNIFKDCNITLFDIIYGNSMDVYDDKIIEKKYNEKVNLNYFIRGNGICHQVVFARKCTFDENNFELKYKICADKNWLIKCYKKKMKFKYIDLTISYYDRNGISSNISNLEKLRYETRDIIINNFKCLGKLRYYLKDKVKSRFY